MKDLEDSTLDLIFRRRVRSHPMGYVLLASILMVIISLPLVKVDVFTSVRGMVRPVSESSELFSSRGGMVKRSMLKDNLEVEAGDTLVWMRRELPVAKIEACRERIHILKASAADIQLILSGKAPFKTSQYRQSHKNHLSEQSRLEIRKEFLSREYASAQHLYTEEVISLHEFEKARSAYREICARESDLKEAYKNLLEEDLFRIRTEISELREHMRLTQSSLDEYYILAPVPGTLFKCRNLSEGSVVHTGLSLGMILPSGVLAAECYLDPGQIASVQKGSRVKLRFDDVGYRRHHPLETQVDLLDQEVSLYKGFPSYRIRCTLPDSRIRYTNGSSESLKNGMTFTASILLFRRSLASLILGKASFWVHPGFMDSHENKGP